MVLASRSFTLCELMSCWVRVSRRRCPASDVAPSQVPCPRRSLLRLISRITPSSRVCFGQSFVFLPLSVLRFLSQRIQLSLISSSIYHRCTDAEGNRLCRVTLLCKWQLCTTRDLRGHYQRNLGTTSMWHSFHIMEKNRGARTRKQVLVHRKFAPKRDHLLGFVQIPCPWLFDDALLQQLT